LRTHRSALHFFSLPQSSRPEQEDSLAYVSKLGNLSPHKRFLCFHEAYTPKAYFEKKDKPTHGTHADELLQETSGWCDLRMRVTLKKMVMYGTHGGAQS